MFYRAQPFVDPTLNAIKGVSEFIIFGVLLVGMVEQTAAIDDFSSEPYDLEHYGHAQTLLCVMYAPVVIICREWHVHTLEHLHMILPICPSL